MIINTMDKLVEFLTQEIIKELDNIFKPVGGFAEFVKIVSDIQGNEEKIIKRPVLYPLIMPQLISGSNHR